MASIIPYLIANTINGIISSVSTITEHDFELVKALVDNGRARACNSFKMWTNLDTNDKRFRVDLLERKDDWDTMTIMNAYDLVADGELPLTIAMTKIRITGITDFALINVTTSNDFGTDDVSISKDVTAGSMVVTYKGEHPTRVNIVNTHTSSLSVDCYKITKDNDPVLYLVKASVPDADLVSPKAFEDYTDTGDEIVEVQVGDYFTLSQNDKILVLPASCDLKLTYFTII
jgi:hypothetical protein